VKNVKPLFVDHEIVDEETFDDIFTEPSSYPVTKFVVPQLFTRLFILPQKFFLSKENFLTFNQTNDTKTTLHIFTVTALLL